MEVGKFTHDYIKIFDNFIEEEELRILTKVCKVREFSKYGELARGALDKEIRNVKIWEMEHLKTNNYTQIFWTNFFGHTFKKAIKKYADNFKLNSWFNILDIQILKYTPGGHYKFHCDDCSTSPRTISCIFFVNDDYEGGDLVFRFPECKDLVNIEKTKNRMIVWPSNSIFEHCVTPVTKGERYSVVSWAK